MGEQKPLGKTPLQRNPSPKMTYLPYLPQGTPKHLALATLSLSLLNACCS